MPEACGLARHYTFPLEVRGRAISGVWAAHANMRPMAANAAAASVPGAVRPAAPLSPLPPVWVSEEPPVGLAAPPAEPVAEPPRVGVAELAGYVEPKGLISKGSDSA